MSLPFSVKKSLRMMPRNRTPEKRRAAIWFSFPKSATFSGLNNPRRFRRQMPLMMKFKKCWTNGRECHYTMRF